jgi:hypothetical protein
MSGHRKTAVGALVALLATALVLTGCKTAPVQETKPKPQLVSDEERKDGWFPLFNGADLTGWQATGLRRDTFYVKDGIIECNGTGGGWLRTEKTFENFILRLEYKMSKGANSGIAVRATPEGNPAFTGMEIQLLDDYGRRATPNTTGSIYDSVAPTENMSKPAGEWNGMEITCNNRQVKIVMNGKQIVDANLDDYTVPIHDNLPLKDRAPSGFVELQDYGQKKLIWFRNIRLKPLPGGVGWQPLFNHKDLTGWETVGTAQWTVENGVLVGSRGQGHIFTTASYDNFMLRTSLRINRRGNSGVYFRVQDKAQWPTGYEAQVDQHDPKNPTGSIYGMYKASKLITRDAEWLTMQVTADGPHIVVEVNGQTVVDAQDTKFQRGPIALQAHDATSVVEYRDVELKPLSSGAK